ncbi:hypothetical protein V6Z11_A08G141600 [Gossypium hirsutum]
MNLSGTLAPELGQLSHVKILHFMWNELTGNIPKEVHSAIQRELPVVIAKARKLITLSKFRIHIQRTRNITATHWDRAVRIQNQATHKSYIWSLDCHCNQ